MSAWSEMLLQIVDSKHLQGYVTATGPGSLSDLSRKVSVSNANKT